MYKIMIVDLETENKPWLGHKASPHNPENYIVAPGWRVDTVNDDGSVTVGEVQWRYFDSKEQCVDSFTWFDVVDEVSIIVAHNAAFEIQWFLSYYREKFENFIRRGGRILDTALAEYLLSDQTEMYPALDEVAPRYGGTHKVDGVKILWEQGKLTSEIDKDLLIEYLAGPSGDIDNTGLVFYGQMRALVERDAWRMFLERCDAVLAYAYCEWFGLYVNTDIAWANYKEQMQQIETMQAELEKLLPELPAGCEFNWGSRFHLSALVFGGPVKYRHKVPYDPPQFVKYDAVKFQDGTYKALDTLSLDGGIDYELVAAYELDHGPVDRYRSGKNRGEIKVYREDTDEQKLKWEDTHFMLPGLVQISELPEAVAVKYTDKRGEFRGAQTLADGSPVYATSEESLKAVKQWAPKVGLLVDLATLRKDTGTYYYSAEYDDAGNVTEEKGMLTYVGPDNIVHHSLNSTATVTGRLSSSRPNLQNLPRDGTSKVKQMFTSRFGADGRIIEVDYSALEVVMLCALTGDTDLLQKLLDGVDMHTYRLAFREGVDYEWLKAIIDDEDHPEHAKWKQMRTDIKPLAFADQYGASAEGLAFNTGCSIEFAQEFQENEARMFPISRGFRATIRAEVERTGNLPGNVHREQRDDGSWGVYRRGYWQAPGGTRYSFRQMPRWDRETRQHVMDYKDTQLANYWCQGEAGFMMAVSMGRIVRHFIAERWYDNKVCLINNVHDAAYADAADEDVGRRAAIAMRDIMADAPRYMTEIWPAYNMAHVPFPAAAEMGSSMYSKSHIH